ncbi:hypothetical protein Ae263Ps1_3293c [Pseudonocardia sp. Ae263_Ps1]|nr:hypothetical protein Ae263Ps1_3293c [Pseudonocardia sp. Ae263_Ps1]OLL93731.1 hypothetical protein Ae356Ps1_3628 [Pseudonocardia sp. Ae356_Ps1]
MHDPFGTVDHADPESNPPSRTRHFVAGSGSFRVHVTRHRTTTIHLRTDRPTNNSIKE